MDAFDPEPQGAFMSALDWLDRWSGPVKNVLRGNFAGAGRQTVDLLGDVADAALPGDWIPHIAHEEDKVDPSELLGMDKEAHPFLAGATDFLGNVLLNPSTYIPGAVFAKGLKGAGSLAAKGAAMLPEAAQPAVAAAKNFGGEAAKLIRKTAGGQKILPETAALAREARGAAGSVNEVKAAAIEQMLQGSSPEARKRAFQIVNNLQEKEPGVWDTIDQEALNPDYTMLPNGQRAASLKATADATQPVHTWELNNVEKMLGTNGPERPYLGSEQVPVSNIDRSNEMVYGIPAEKERVGASNLPELKAPFSRVEDSVARYADRVAKMPWSDAEKAQVMQVLEKVAPYTQREYREAVEAGAMYRPQGIDLALESPTDYAHRSYTGLTNEEDLDLIGNQNSLKTRTLKTGQSLADFMNKNKDVSLEMDIGKAMATRAQQQARMFQRTKIGKSIIEDFADSGMEKRLKNPNPYDTKATPTDVDTGVRLEPGADVPTEAENLAQEAKYKTLADPEFRTAVNSALKEIAKVHPEDAQVLDAHFNGLKPPGPVVDWLNRMSRPFKQAALYGYVIPRFGFSFGNRISSFWHVLANPEARSMLGKDVKRFLGGDLLRSLDDSFVESFGTKRISGDVITKDLDAAQNAIRATNAATNGSTQAALDAMPQYVREAYQHNVLNGTLMDGEEMISKMDRAGLSSKWANLKEWPSEIGKAVENRMRYGLFRDLRESGKSAADAARITEDTYFAYNKSSEANRLARTVWPFFQFQAKAIPQSARFLAEKPYSAVIISQLMNQKHGPVYPWMSGHANIPLGQDEQKNDLYLTSLRAPFESLNAIPNPSASLQDFGRDLEKNAVGSANPLLKFAYSTTSGREPFFDNQFGSYDKIPLIGESGDAGRLYNEAAASGLIQPIDSLLRTLGQATDSRHSLPVRAADMLTGFNFADVDPDVALQKQLQEELLTNPDVQQYRSFFDKSNDPETQKILKEYQEAKKRVKAKRASSPKGS